MEAQKSKKRRFPILRFILSIFLIAILILIGISEIGPVSYDKNYPGKHPEPVYNRTLSESEMALPFEGYRNNFLGERSIKLSYPAPYEKPQVEWIHKTYLDSFGRRTTDSQGGALFFSNDVKPYLNPYEIKKLKPKRRTILVRLDPENSISWKRIFYEGFRDYVPVAVCNGAVVWQIKTMYYSSYSPPYKNFVSDFIKILFRIPDNEISLECIDNDGEIAWRTQIYKVTWEYYFSSSSLFRISGNRMMAATGRSSSGTFAIFSLSDGKLIESIKFPGWNDGYKNNIYGPLLPIEIPGKGWIGYQRDGIVLFDSNLKTVWKQGIPAKELQSQPCILSGLLIISTDDYIHYCPVKTR